MTIFDIYRHYRAAINSIIGTEESTDNEIEFSLLSEPNDEFNTFAAKQKEYINKIIMESDALFLDGFLFFDDLQSYIIKSALEQEKTVYIVSKQFADGMGRFILEDALKPFLEAFEGDLDYLVVEQNDKSLDTALDIAKKHYPNIFISAFEGCTSLETITFWGGEMIGESAFKGCTSLEDVSIPSDIEIIGKFAFENCTGLEDLTIWGSETIGEGAFRGCIALEELSIPSDTKTIESYAFYGCTNLEDVTIWDDDTELGTDVFGNCPNLKDY